MTVLYVLLALIILVVAALFVNVHFIFRYHEKEKITLRILCFRFDAKKLLQRFTVGSKKKEIEQTKRETSSSKPKLDLVGFVEFLLHVTRVIKLAIKESLNAMKINLKELIVSVGTDDAAKTALTAGAAIQAANGLCAVLQHFSDFRCDNRRLSISPDFTSETTKFSIHLDISIKPFHIIAVLLRTYIRFFEREDSAK